MMVMKIRSSNAVAITTMMCRVCSTRISVTVQLAAGLVMEWLEKTSQWVRRNIARLWRTVSVWCLIGDRPCVFPWWSSDACRHPRLRWWSGALSKQSEPAHVHQNKHTSCRLDPAIL